MTRHNRRILTLVFSITIILLPLCVFPSVLIGHSTRSNTQRNWSHDRTNLYVDDFDQDGVDEFLLFDGNAIFVTGSDQLAIGQSYGRVPFLIETIVTGGLLGHQQPRLICAIGRTVLERTNVTCAVLHTKRFELEWIVPSESLPFSLLDRTKTVTSSSLGVDIFVADLNGDGREEIVTYRPSDGQMNRFELAPTDAVPSTFKFIQLSGPITFRDSVRASDGALSYAVTLPNQSVYAGQLMDCSCAAVTANPPDRCFGQSHKRTGRSFVMAPPERIWREPVIPLQPPDYSSAPKAKFALDRTTRSNAFPTDDLMMIDSARGTVQVFGSCVGSSTSSNGIQLERILVSRAGFIKPAERISLAVVRGLDQTEDLVLHDPSSGKIRVYRVLWNERSGGRLERVQVDTGELGKVVKKLAESSITGSISWMRINKPRVVQPDSYNDAYDSSIDTYSIDNVDSSSLAIHVPSPAATCFLRSDAVVFDPSRQLFHFFASTFVSSVERGRMVHEVGESKEISVLEFDPHEKISLGAPSPMIPAPVFGRSTFLFSFSQFPLSLLDDPDGDSIATIFELGGLDVNGTGVSNEPLHLYGCSPFRKDVLVEVDWMEDESKSMRPRDGFDQPAKEDFKDHGIELHVFLDSSVPRVENLGGRGNFSWTNDFDPIRKNHFTPSRIGLFHYCVFLDRFNGGSTSGQSLGVPGSSFFVSLGGWSGGRGTLQQQQGTFLHELGHNLNLMHGGNDDQNWKPNHLSVMNYQFQVVGVQRDGRRTFVLSDLDCDDLDESALLESRGVHCRQGQRSRRHTYQTQVGTHTYQTQVDGKWFELNKPIDFNEDGKIEDGVSYDLNGDSLVLLTGSPNEYVRMRFSGLDSVPAGITFNQMSIKNERMMREVQMQSSEDTTHQRQLLQLHDSTDLSELSFDEYQSTHPYSSRFGDMVESTLASVFNISTIFGSYRSIGVRGSK